MDTPSSQIDAASLAEYFQERIHDALVRQKVKAPEGVEYYLVNLLNEFASKNDVAEPLAFTYIKAVQSDSNLRVQLFRRLGDFSLFISGFFPESFHRRLLDVNYYIQMGECAYGNLSQLLSKHAAFSEIFTELANRFGAYVDILADVSEKSRLRKDTDLLRLYEVWLKTGSERAARLLAQEGISLLPNPFCKSSN